MIVSYPQKFQSQIHFRTSVETIRILSNYQQLFQFNQGSPKATVNNGREDQRMMMSVMMIFSYPQKFQSQIPWSLI